VRECATELLGILDDVGDDVLRREEDLTAVMVELLAVPGLDEVVAGPATAQAGPFSTGWLYYDCDLRITRGTVPAGFAQRPHNHGTWNLFGVYGGAMHYRSYRRLDDRTVPFLAELEVAVDTILRDGDVTILPAPPDDIHCTTALAPSTTTILVQRGEFSSIREQYLPELRSYHHASAEAAAR
jgi:predicted metal-dependent enzyme (double-stranded beta helix superfamily)